MKRKIIATCAAISMIGVVFSTASFAEEMVENEPAAEPVVQDSTVENDPTPEPDPTYAPGMSPGEHGAWVPVDANGNAYADVIVCTPEVCGQTGPGSFAELAYGEGTRMILQTLQDPVEAANSSNGVGNVAGYNNAKYNNELSRWEIHEFVDYDKPYKIYQIPLAYPNSEEGKLICLENCTEDPVVDEGATPTNDVVATDTLSTETQEIISEEVIAKQGQYFVSRISNNTRTQYLIVKPRIKKNKFFFWYNAGTKRLYKNVTVTFEGDKEKVSKSFKIRKDGRVKIEASNSFLDDDIIIQNNNKILERIVLVQ